MSAPGKSYMVHESCLINIRKCKKNSHSAHTTGNQPPTKVHFQVRKYIPPVEACVWYNDAASFLQLVYEQLKRIARALNLRKLKTHVQYKPLDIYASKNMSIS